MTEEETTNLIFVEDKDPEGDIAMIFGMWEEWQDSLVRALELYNGGKVKYVLISHGINPQTSENEGDKMAEDILNLGLPEDKFMLENSATNTLENVLFSKELISQKFGLNNIKSIVAVCANFHAKRVLLTLKKHFPKTIELKVSTYIYPRMRVTKDDWHETEEGRTIVNREVEKIKLYSAKGDIAGI